MTVLSRRDVIRSTSLTFAVPFALSATPSVSFGQVLSPNPSNASPITFSTDLAKYAQKSIRSIIVAAKNGSLSSSHLQHAASCTHLFARHIESLNIDQDFTSLAAAVSYSAYSSNVDNSRSQALASLQSFDPTLQLSDMPSFNLTEDEFETLKAKVSSLGLSGVQHSTANAYTAAQNHMQSSAFNPTEWNPIHHAPSNDLVYRSNGSPHFRLACLSKADKESICSNFNATTKTLEITGGLLTILGGFCTAALITGPLEPILCGLGAASLGISLFLHGLALEELVSWAGC
jgi:hypothetical protein